MVALVIVIFDERLNLRFQIAGQIIVLQQDAVLEGLVPTLDLALCLRMEWCTAYMLHILVSEIVGELACDIAGAIVAEHPGLMQHMHRRTDPHKTRIERPFINLRSPRANVGPDL